MRFHFILWQHRHYVLFVSGLIFRGELTSVNVPATGGVFDGLYWTNRTAVTIDCGKE